MSFAEHRAALVDGVFAVLGEDARWSGVADPVRIRRAEYDDDARFGDTPALAMSRFLRVRRSEVARPQEGDVAELLDAEGTPSGVCFEVSGEAALRRNGVWVMPVKLLGA